jgi:hypothetical protein
MVSRAEKFSWKLGNMCFCLSIVDHLFKRFYLDYIRIGIFFYIVTV